MLRFIGGRRTLSPEHSTSNSEPNMNTNREARTRKGEREMGYIEANLLPGESVVQRARLHWIVFLKSIAVASVGVGLLFLQPIAGAVVIAVGVLMAIPPWLERLTSEFGVTSKRVIIKVGLVQRRTLELLIRQVEAISVDQSLAGRIFNFGTITLSGTGGVRETFNNISNPLEFRRSIQSLSTE
jgi:uncharacterized membrane protein YdbT with pleckstrin-like domain